MRRRVSICPTGCRANCLLTAWCARALWRGGAPAGFGGTDSRPCTFCEGNIGASFLPLIALLLILVILLVVFVRGGAGALGAAKSLTKAVSSGNISGEASGFVKDKMEATAQGVYDREVEKSRKDLAGGGASATSARGVKSRLFVLSATLARLWGKFQVKLKILISLVQVINGLGFVFSIPYPQFCSWPVIEHRTLPGERQRVRL